MYKGLRPSYAGFQPRSFARGEWKYTDLALNQDLNTTVQIGCINALALGNTASTRVGMKVEMRTIELCFRNWATAATGVEQFGRFMIVLDKQTNAVGPAAITDILNTAAVTSPRNLANRKRFKILWDRRWALGASNPAYSTGTPTSRIFKAYIKLRRLTTDYNTANNGTVADIASNSLHVLYFGSEAVGATDSYLVGNIRLRYTDL